MDLRLACLSLQSTDWNVILTLLPFQLHPSPASAFTTSLPVFESECCGDFLGWDPAVCTLCLAQATDEVDVRMSFVCLQISQYILLHYAFKYINTWAISPFNLEIFKIFVECVGVPVIAQGSILSTLMWVLENKIQDLGSSLQDIMQKAFPASSRQKQTIGASPQLHPFMWSSLSERWVSEPWLFLGLVKPLVA